MAANDNTIRLPAITKPGTNPAADTGEFYHKNGTKAVYWLDEDGTEYDLTAGAAGAIITTGAGNPASAPGSIGDIYVDTTNDRTFIGVDTAASTDYKVTHGKRGEYQLTTDYTTTSTSMVAVDATNLNLSIVTNGGDVEISFSAPFKSVGGNDKVSLDIYETTTTTYLSGNEGIVFQGLTNFANISHYQSCGFTVRFTGLAAGTRTFQLHWKSTNGNTLTLFGGNSGTAVEQSNPQFKVREV